MNTTALSCNTLYRTFQGRILISKPGRRYKKQVTDALQDQRQAKHYQTITEPCAVDIQLRFKSKRKRDIHLEKEHKPELYKHDRVICSFESLHLLIRDGAMQKFDLVVLDETESLLAHFESPTMKEKRETYNQFMIY